MSIGQFSDLDGASPPNSPSGEETQPTTESTESTESTVSGIIQACGIKPVKPAGYDLWKSGQPAAVGSPQHTNTPARGTGRPDNSSGETSSEVPRGSGRPE